MGEMDQEVQESGFSRKTNNQLGALNRQVIDPSYHRFVDDNGSCGKVNYEVVKRTRPRELQKKDHNGFYVNVFGALGIHPTIRPFPKSNITRESSLP